MLLRYPILKVDAVACADTIPLLVMQLTLLQVFAHALCCKALRCAGIVEEYHFLALLEPSHIFFTYALSYLVCICFLCCCIAAKLQLLSDKHSRLGLWVETRL